MAMNKNTKTLGAIALAVVALGIAVYSANATSSSKDGGFANFESADKNSDSVLDRAEFAAFLKSASALPAAKSAKGAKGGEGGCSGGGCSGGEGGCSGGGCSEGMTGSDAPATEEAAPEAATE